MIKKKTCLFISLIMIIALGSGCVSNETPKSIKEVTPVITSVPTTVPITTQTTVPTKTQTTVPTTTQTTVPTTTQTTVPTTAIPTIQKTASASPTATQTPVLLQTGTVLKRTLSRGTGTLEIDNKINSDTIMSLSLYSDEQTSLFKVYIRAADKYTISDIPDGTYTLFYMSGKDWNTSAERFNSMDEISKFDDSLAYDQSANFWSATLYPVEGGNALITSVSESEFPR